MKAIVQSGQRAVRRSTRGAKQAIEALVSGIALAVLIAMAPLPAAAQDYGLEGEARWALNRLMATVPTARMLEQQAYATLVFPDITKAGFLVGGEYGNGVLFRRGGVAGYYNLSGVSYGYQVGAQTFGYALFFMNEWSWRALNSQDGFQVGVGPSVVVLDEGTARSVTSTTLTSDVYAFVFGQQGLMAGAGIQGTKITRLNY